VQLDDLGTIQTIIKALSAAQVRLNVASEFSHEKTEFFIWFR
jgi:hypothetical protein